MKLVISVKSERLESDPYAASWLLMNDSGQVLSEDHVSCPDDPALVRATFWKAYQSIRMKHYPKEISVWARFAWPQVSNFLFTCICERPGDRLAGPHPLHEISTLMEATGRHGLRQHPRFHDELERLPLGDVRQAARLLRECIILFPNFACTGFPVTVPPCPLLKQELPND